MAYLLCVSSGVSSDYQTQRESGLTEGMDKVSPGVNFQISSQRT